MGNFKYFVAFVLLVPTYAEANQFKYQLEGKFHYRASDENRFATAFPFPPEALPIGESSAFLETVDPGDHIEISALSLSGRWRHNSGFSALFRIDAIDRYDRNPTSEDHEIDLDSLVLRYQTNLSKAPSSNDSFYLQIGKFAKFERQEQRRLESYGLVATAFNRFEDSGIESGLSFTNGVYAKLSYTTGNAVFIRDPNALAGDNGVSELRIPPNNPDPNLGSGIVVLYDAEIENFNLDDSPELGVGVGYRWQEPGSALLFDLLLYGYQRELQQSRSLNGTFYGADLDLLDLGEVLPGAGIQLPVSDDEKTEIGFNVRYERLGFSLWGQYVEQSLAGLDRQGLELELAYTLNTKTKITPVLRYSELDNDFVGDSRYPAPSVWWDWRKVDAGVNFKINKKITAIVEYSFNDFIRGGKTESNNELLVSIRASLGN